ncbi:MAG: class I SAM-dependent methyltransferase [Rhodobiaceae bacterium]|nr:class I SAM-dependent methyltransferase [Rhodobiaceae bacterium]
MAFIAQGKGLAFGVDTRRKERYSLRQSRYYALSLDISALAGAARREGRRLKLLDIGVGTGICRRYIEVQPDADNIDYYGADLQIYDSLYRPDDWQAIYVGDLMDGYPQAPDDFFDAVICEQVLEHVPELDTATRTLSRVLRPGGTLIVGVPTFPEGLHLVRKYVVPAIDRINPWAKRRGHVQAFSKRSFIAHLRRLTGLDVEKARGFRIVSGGILRPLENREWWWRLNRRVGEAVPGLCVEIQVVARKAPQG